MTDKGLICVVAMLKGEEPFIDEWIAYHRIIGVDHFLLYDNDSTTPLKHLLKRHADYVTVIDWPGEHDDRPGRNKQTKAYADSLHRISHRWVAFIDGDEFIVLRKHANLQQFLDQFEDVGAVLLTWHVFGNSDHYSNPKGLITASLTRRKLAPGRMTKSINKVNAISSINSAHFCKLKRGLTTVDANKRPYSEKPYRGRTDVAHINHYMCRSFENWMNRVERGEAAFAKENYPKDKDHRWRFERALCQAKFVEISKETNELVDEFMLQYSEPIQAFLNDESQQRATEEEDLVSDGNESTKISLQAVRGCRTFQVPAQRQEVKYRNIRSFRSRTSAWLRHSWFLMVPPGIREATGSLVSKITAGTRWSTPVDERKHDSLGNRSSSLEDQDPEGRASVSR